ncbi:hypothetical protein EMIHUDRAFT_447664 [Emiliania huxleyi CCMP1516]|uniref:Uncharacterized protein n=2 Tax=Emiliania huxleyi TaxID=2903 RepID=A0A0D3JH01_EMIH1|nr:hypothetical protein EMIHUDRAFT_447664 [Emiliania huxleyi CCMP1516]EOD22786.1 hypothetical protein EMIHUDRAFT_447664 [Emiliania huxleyi CCMP1516]|eukprot:XP_005775215.1 hypothetical protein EMIHUDRAFT_447664 [Emiliania huxleyi CCMP1516]
MSTAAIPPPNSILGPGVPREGARIAPRLAEEALRRAAPPAASALSQCVARARAPAPLDALLVVMMASAGRGAALAAHARTWLRAVRAFIVCDRPPDPALGLVNSSRMRIAVLSGVAGCRNSDLYSTAIVLGNRTFPDYSWMLFTEDDTFFVPRSLASFLGIFDPQMPLWFSAHGCEASYPPVACVDSRYQRAAERHVAPHLRGGRAAQLLQPMFGPAFAKLDGRGRRVDLRGRNMSAYVRDVTSNCGGLGCVFSRALVHGLPASDLEACHGCAVGIADLQTSRCMYGSSGVGPIGVPAFSWGQSAARALEGPPEGLAPRGRQPGGPRRGGALGIFSVHMRSQWGRAHQRGQQLDDPLKASLHHPADPSRNSLVDQQLNETVEAAHRSGEALHAAIARLEADGQRDASAEAERRRVCCQLVTADLPICENGCTPWPAATRSHSSWCEDPHAAPPPREEESPLAAGELRSRPLEARSGDGGSLNGTPARCRAAQGRPRD